MKKAGGAGVEPGVQFLNVDVDVHGATDSALLEKGLGDAAFVLSNEQVLVIELAGADAPGLEETVARLVAVVRSLPPDARAVWDGAEKRVFDIGIQAGLDPHQSRWALPAALVRAVAEIDAEIAITVYGARMAPASTSFPARRREGTTLFDAYIACDWSASSAPKSGRDSLWLCRARYANDELAWEIENPRTRQEAQRVLRGWLVAGVEANERTLAGFDFSFGLPAIAYAGLGVAGWRGYWERLRTHVVDGARNENNRFAVARALNWRADLADGGPFWGVPPGSSDGHLRATKPPPAPQFPEYRAVEVLLRARKHRPFSAWQLLGNGSVGSQSLVGIPMLEVLRTDPALAPHVRVWPFEPEPARVVLAEVWPSLVHVDLGRHPVRDAAQMIALVSWMATEDVAGRLGTSLAIANAPPEARTEGWVLGVDA